MHIRPAALHDAPALLALRNHYVRESFATFDEQALELQDVERWIAAYAERGPYRLLVGVEADTLLGFCSSQAYRAHPAFATTAETSVYVAPDASRRGVGAALYGALFEALAPQGLHRVVVGIALPNEPSIALHARFGFTPVGTFDGYARKNGRYVSSLWMERRMEGVGAA